MKILALDLGKSKMAACVYHSLTHEYRFDGAPLERGMLSDVLGQERPDRVVIEVGPSAGWVGDLVRRAGIELQVANPNHEGWRWRNVRRKTDRLDALKLAQLSASDQLPQVHLPNRGVRQWRSLIHYRQRLVTRRTAVKNRCRSILEAEGIPTARGVKCWTQAGVSALRSQACPWEETSAEELWRGELWEELEQFERLTAALQRVEKRLDAMAKSDRRVALLQTIPGVGPRLAEAVVALVDDPHRFGRGKQVASYLGLTPRQYQSGQMDRQGRISGQGDRRVRALLVEVAWIGQRYNPWMQETFQRLCHGSPARRKIAVVGVARRLVIRCWAMLRDHARWSPPPMTQAA
ncbi:MAG: IS110 family transposase [Planctomycetales bacterium]|nr:IS110 family transposase [Planctomycetales bacterium]NIP68020.1 IS110 family transposase [Planctomycetales bacterium]